MKPSYHVIFNGQFYTAYAVEDSDIQESNVDPVVALQLLRLELFNRGLLENTH